MKYEEIQQLLDRYWEGETSLQEEREIKAYFQSGGVDPRLQPIAPMFAAFKEEQTVQLKGKSKNVAMRPRLYLWAVAAALAVLVAAVLWISNEPGAIENPVATTIPKSKPQPEPSTKAAPQVVATDVPKTTSNAMPGKARKSRPNKQKPEIDAETAQAMEEIKAALALVSSKLNKGRDQAIKGASYLESVDKVPKRDNG